MIRVLSLLISFILLPLLSVSCGHQSDRNLLHIVKPLLSEKPDSALALLDSMATDRLDKKSQAEFALFYSMALDKNFIDVVDDSLINRAVKWYRHHGSAEEKLRAYYYQGRVYQNAGELEKAMESFFMAEKYADRSGDEIQEGLLFNAKAAVYESLFRFEEAIENAKVSSGLYLSAKDTVRYINSQLFICSEYISVDKCGEAENILSGMEAFLPKMTDIKKNDYYIMRMHVSVSKNEGIRECISEYLSNVTDTADINWIALAYGYREIQEYSLGLEALSHYRKADPEYDSNPAYLLVDSELNELTGQYSDALRSYRKYVELTDNTDMDIFESDAKFTEDRLLAVYKIRNRNLWIVILVLGVAAAVSSGLLIAAGLKEKIRKRQEEKERLEKEKRLLEKEMASYRSLYEQAVAEKKNLQRIRKGTKLDSEIKSSIGERLDVLNRFITASVSKNLSVSAAEALDDYLRDRDKFIYSTRLSFIILHPGFISYLKDSGLSEIEIGYCCLYCIGMNGSEISAYLKRKSFYNDSSAIRKKLGLEKHDMNLDNFLREKMRILG